MRIVLEAPNRHLLSVMQDSFYRGLSAEESERVHEYNFDHPGNVIINVGVTFFCSRMLTHAVYFLSLL